MKLKSIVLSVWCFVILFSSIFIFTANSEAAQFSFPLAGKTVVMGLSKDDIKKMFPKAKIYTDDYNHQNLKKYGEMLSWQPAQWENITFAFNNDKLILVDMHTSIDTHNDDTILNFDRWLRKKYGKGKKTKRNGNDINKWSVSNVNIMEEIYFDTGSFYRIIVK